MRDLKVRLTANMPWNKWTAETESGLMQFVQDLAKEFGHRASVVSLNDPLRWRMTAFISARSAREGEEMRREGRRLARTRNIDVSVGF